MKLISYRRPSLKTILGITKAQKTGEEGIGHHGGNETISLVDKPKTSVQAKNWL